MNYYTKAIRILSDIEDAEKLIFEIAGRNPKAVYDAHVRLYGKPEKYIDDVIKDLANGGMSKINCIKKYRGETGAGLKESLDYVEAIVPQFKRKRD